MKLNDESTLRCAAIGLALVGVILFAGWAVLPATRELSFGYATYYTAARLVGDGVETDRFYDDSWFRARTVEMGFDETSDIFNINPPAVALLLLPVIEFSPGQADVVWTLFNVLLLGIALATIVRTLEEAGLEVRRNRPVFWAFVALTAVYNPLWENIFFGQVYLLLLVLLAFAMRSYVLQRWRSFGFWLGLMLAIKSSGALLWILIVLGKRPRAGIWGIGTILAVIILSAPLLGFSIWGTYLRRLPDLFNQPWSGVTAYQTTTSFVHHNFHAESTSNGSPIVNYPGIVVPLTLAVNAIIIALAALSGWVLQRPIPPALLRLARFGLVSSLAIPLQPLGEEYHFVLVLPALLTALALALHEPDIPRRNVILFCALTCALLLAVPFPHTHPSLSAGFRALLAYPKLYGAILTAGAMTVYLIITPAGWANQMRQQGKELMRVIRQQLAHQRPEFGRLLQDRRPRL